MKLEAYEGQKRTGMDFSGKLLFAQIWAKRAQNGLKMDLWTFSQNRVISFGWKWAKMMDIMVRMYGTPFTCLGKLWFLRFRGSQFLSNQIAQFFDQPYLLNRLMIFFDFMHGVKQP